MAQRRRQLALYFALGVVVLAGIGLFLCTAQGEYWWKYVSGSFKEALYSRPVTLERQAKTLVQSLDRYFADKGEYPPYLFGGNESDMMLEHGSRDPLLEGGYISAYAEFPVFIYSSGAAISPSKREPRGFDKIRNVVSTPHDGLVVYFRNILRSKHLQYKPHTNTEVPDLPRFFCCGGHKGPRRTSYFGPGQERITEYYISATVPAAFSQLQTSSYVDFSFTAYRVSGHFGYQRGDTIEALEGGTPQEAWLWFYGFGPTYGEKAEDLPGLDLVDNANGLIQPDGIPDGIVLLHKLKEGKVIEVVKKYD